MTAELPYYDAETERSSGWSGSDTSRDRAHRDDSSGRTADRQKQVIEFLHERGPLGGTWTEIAQYIDSHHGTTSGVLSNLHTSGKIARLVETRNRSKIYVHPIHVGGRDVEQPTKNLNAQKMSAMRRIIKQAEEREMTTLPLDMVKKIIEYKEN